MSRAVPGHDVMPMTRMMFVSDRCQHRREHDRERDERDHQEALGDAHQDASVRPPAYPATMPKPAPITTAMSVAARPTKQADPRAPDRRGSDAAPELVGAEDELAARRRELGVVPAFVTSSPSLDAAAGAASAIDDEHDRIASPTIPWKLCR